VASGRRGDPKLALQFQLLDCFGLRPSQNGSGQDSGRWYNAIRHFRDDDGKGEANAPVYQ
jgi:hypothetical protein